MLNDKILNSDKRFNYDELEIIVFAILKNITNSSQIKKTDRLIEDLGLESFDFVELYYEIEKFLNVQNLKEINLYDAKNVGQLITMLDNFCKEQTDVNGL